MVWESARAYARDKLLPRVVSAFAEERFDREIMTEMGALGLLGLAIWGVLWLRRATPRRTTPRILPDAARFAWWISLPVILVAAWVLGLLAFGPLSAQFTVAHLAYRVLPPACAVWGVLTLVLCVVLAARRPRLAA